MHVKLSNIWPSVTGGVTRAKSKAVQFYDEAVSNVVLLSLGGSAFAMGTAGIGSASLFMISALYQYMRDMRDRKDREIGQQNQDVNDHAAPSQGQKIIKALLQD